MPDHMNPLDDRFDRPRIHPVRIILRQPFHTHRKNNSIITQNLAKKKRPNSIARSSQTRQTCGVAVDGERTGRERRTALVKCCSERRPERGRVGGRERVVLVENDAAEPGAAELSPVEPPDVLHRHVRQRQARLGRRDGRHRGHTGWVEPLPQGAPPPRCRAHGGRSVR